MTQQEAIEIIVRQGLTHYHMDERETDEDIMAALNRQNARTKEEEIIIRKRGEVWHVYTIDKEYGKMERGWNRLHQEERAWDRFIWMLQWQQDRIHCRGTRREVEKIMRQEGLTVNFHGVTWNPRDGIEFELAIKAGLDGLWHIYKLGDRASVMWEETFEVEEEAWGEYLWKKRSEYQWDMEMKMEREEEKRLSSLTREQAEEVIRQKGLIQYNMDEDQEEKEGDTVIRERTHWEVYEVTGIGEKNEKKLARFFQEEEAWGYLVKKLRCYNERRKRGLRRVYAMEEEEVKQIIDREGLTGYSRGCVSFSKPDVIIIGTEAARPEDFWQIVEEDRENESGHRMVHFASKGEAWRWLLERLREKNGRVGNQTEGETSCYLSREEAEEIIRQEGLAHYNIDPETKENPGDLVLRKCRHWEIYRIQEDAPVNWPLYIRYNEKEAWGLFIRKLKNHIDNKNLQAVKRQREEDREREEKLKKEAIKAHVMPRERAEQILAQENLTGYNKNEPREDQPEEMVIRRRGENWEVYCTDSNGEVHGEKELFTVEEEAWGWFIKGVRDNAKIREINRQLFGQDCLFAKIER